MLKVLAVQQSPDPARLDLWLFIRCGWRRISVEFAFLRGPRRQ